jgi:hypothetical protein
MKALFLAICLILLGVHSIFAQMPFLPPSIGKDIDMLPPASVPFTGNEEFPCWQNNATYKCTLGYLNLLAVDIRSFGATFISSDNTTPLQNALIFTQSFGGCVYVPGGPGFMLAGNLPSIDPGGAAVNVFTGSCIVGDRIGGVGSGGLSILPSRLINTGNSNGITPVSGARINNVKLSFIEIDGNAGLAPVTNTTQTIGIDNGFGTGWQLDHVTVSNYVSCVRPASGDEAWVGLYCNQQSSYPSPPGGNMYPAYGILSTYNGQLQGINLSGGSISAMQMAHGFLFMGDGFTNTFTADLSTLGNSTTHYYLYKATGITPLVNGIPQTPINGFSETDTTTGAPSPIIYISTPTTTLIQNSFNFSVSSNTGLPSTVNCTGIGAFDGCTPLVFIEPTGTDIPALPVGSFIHSISGTTGTFDNPDHVTARVGMIAPINFAEGEVAGSNPNCFLNRADNTIVPVTSKCGSKIQFVFTTPPPSNVPVELLWSDPWGLACISLKAGAASYNRIVGVNCGSYDEGIEDVSNGSNTLQVMYFQIMNRTLDIWTQADNISIPEPNATVQSSPNPLGTLAGTDKLTINSLVETDLVEPGFLIGGDLSVNPYPVGVNFTNITGLTNTAAGWWAYPGDAPVMEAAFRSPGVNNFTSLGMELQRPMGNTDTSSISGGMTILPDRAIALSGGLATLSCSVDPGLDFSALNGNVSFLVASGTSQGTNLNTEGTANWLANLWTNQQTLLNVTEQVTTTRRFTYTFFVPQNTQELAWDVSFIPTGTAGVNDYLRLGACQLEPGAATQFVKYPQSQEVNAANTLYQSSYPPGTAPGTASPNGAISIQSTSGQVLTGNGIFNPQLACLTPIIHLYATTPANIIDNITLQGGSNVVIAYSGVSNKGFTFATTAPVSVTGNAQYQYYGDCRPQ